MELRSIHLPEPIHTGVTTPTILAALVLLVIAGALWAWLRRRRRRAPLTLALLELDSLRTAHADGQDNHVIVAQTSALVRRYAIARWPDQNVAALRGEAWAAVLAGAVKDATLAQQLVSALERTVYQPPDRLERPDCKALLEATRLWFRAQT